MVTLQNVLSTPSVTSLLDMAVRNDAIRSAALKVAEKALYKQIVERNLYNQPIRAQMDKFYIARNMLYSLDRALSRGTIAPHVRTSVLKILMGKILSEDVKVRQEITAEQGMGIAPPTFLTISPTKRCNLRCVGCYAESSAGMKETLDYEVLDRIVTEKTEMWHAHFTVISGGEPLMYKSRGKDILDLCRAHPDNYFMMYTNGTLIDRKMAERMAEVGNLSPAISVEGLEQETDARRGKGVHRKILRAFENLRQVGVPFGISATATRFNAEIVVSDPFVDFYFEEQGAVYGWIFHYMPIGRKFTLDLMITPEQRRMMFEREQILLRDRKIFLADFWNCGALSDGCISAGRTGGYFYIDWNGNVTPCVFFPYSVHNIVEVYRSGGDLNTVLNAPFLQAIRAWQEEYGFRKPAREVGNRIAPCVIRDHHRVAREAVERFGARPIDEAAGEALKDEEYFEGMVAYGEAVDRATKDIWETEYIAPEREKTEEAARIAV